MERFKTSTRIVPDILRPYKGSMCGKPSFDLHRNHLDKRLGRCTSKDSASSGKVWCRISALGIVGLFFLDGTGTLLEESVCLHIAGMFCDDEVHFQQDGVPTHFHRDVSSSRRINYRRRGPSSTMRVPQISRQWTSFHEDTSRAEFIAEHQEKPMH
ncbi:hypothetical protein J6590_090965 [Homalodisca vitripennis]|nr:hypothetical protein J6590_090965 [Homalodisca vitripennis]